MINKIKHLYYSLLSNKYRTIYKYCEFQKPMNANPRRSIHCVSSNSNYDFTYYDEFNEVAVFDKSNGVMNNFLKESGFVDNGSMYNFLKKYKGIHSVATKRQSKLSKIK